MNKYVLILMLLMVGAVGCESENYSNGKAWRWWVVFEDDTEILIDSPKYVDFDSNCAGKTFWCRGGCEDVSNYHQTHSPIRGYFHRRRIFKDGFFKNVEQVYFTPCSDEREKKEEEISQKKEFEDNLQKARDQLDYHFMHIQSIITEYPELSNYKGRGITVKDLNTRPPF